MKKLALLSAGLLAAVAVSAKDVIISTQAEFDDLSSWDAGGGANTLLGKYIDELGASETLNIYFAAGVYKFSEETRLFISDATKTGASIRFLPKNGATVYIISDGYEYSASEKKSETATHYVIPLKGTNNVTCSDVFVDGNFQNIPISDSGTLSSAQINRTTDSIIRDSGDELNAHFRIKLPAELAFLKGKSNDFFKQVRIMHKYWYTSYFGKVTGVEGDYLKFDCDPNYTPSALFSNKGFERFYLTNITKDMQPEAGKILVKDGNLYVPKTVNGKAVQKIYECKNARFFGIQNSKLKSIVFSGLNFVGAANYNADWEIGGKSYIYADMPFMEFVDVDNVTVENCTFRNIGSKYCLYFDSHNVGNNFGSSNYMVKNNKAFDLGRGFIESTAANVTVDGNTLDGVGLFLHSSNAIAVSGKDCAITNNKITNFHGNGIFVGRQEWYQSDQYGGGYNTSTNVEGNELAQGTDFWTHSERNMMEDIHAIYFYGHQNKITIKGNVIHDFPGLILNNGDVNNKAIFDDMGGYNCYITGNLVFNVQDIACCITPLAASTFTSDGSVIPAGKYSIVNNNSTVADNVFFAGYTHNPNVFDGNPSDWNTNNVYKTGPNYIAKDANFAYDEGLVKWDIMVEDEHSIVVPDIEDATSKVQGGKCYLTQDYSALGLSDFVKQWIVDASNLQNITLSENEIYTPVTADKQANITLLRTLKTTWSTLCLPFDMTSEQITSTFGADAQVASYANQEGNTLNFSTSTRAIKAHTPCLIKVGTENGTWNISHATLKTGGAGSAQPIGATLALKGIYSPGYVPQNAYFISNNKFYQVETAGSTTIKAFRAYIETASSGAKELQIKIDGEATAIDDIAADKPSTFDVYTTGGSIVRQNASTLNGLPKGIYVLKMADGTTKKIAVEK